MKTIERLDFPLRIYFRDGECFHNSAVIVFTHGAPAYVRASGPFVVYPWENIKHIIRVADETMEIADELKTARADARRLSTLLVSVVSRVSAAFGRPEPDPLDPGAAHDLAGNVKAICDDLASVTEQRDLLKRQLEELRAELASQYPNRNKPPAGFDISRLPKSLRMTVETAGVWGRNALAEAWRIHEEGGKPARPQPKQVEPGGPIWVRVVDTNSKHFGLVGRLEGIEFDSKCGDEMWSVDLGGIANVRWKANVFAVVGTGRQGPGPNEAPKPDTEHQQAQNRDKWRATCLAYGAKDCTVYFGPGSEMTLVVELNDSYRLEDVRRGLYNEHGLRPDQFTLREVRPIVDGVKPSSFKHPADNGQP